MRRLASIIIRRGPFFWEELPISTHLRSVAGACVLFAGLLIGSAGAAIAAADPGASDSAPKTQGVAGPSQSANSASSSAATAANNNSASSSAATAANDLRTTVRQIVLGVTHTLGSLGKPGQQSAGANDSTTGPQSADTKSDKNGAGVTPATTTPLESNSNDSAPVTNAAATDPVAPVSKVVEPISNAVATVASTVESVPAVVMSLPTSATPVADVITTVQNVLTSVADAVVPLAQLPSDLASLLGVTAINTAVITTGGGLSAAGPVAGADAPVIAPPWLQALPIPGIWGVPLAGNVAGGNVAAPAALGRIAAAGLSQEVSTSGVAPLAPAGVIPSDVLSILEHTVGALLVPASLSALAAVALPGVGGLLIACAAGMRVGYRQAKADWAVQITGIARFAGPGPLGVVRSGSLVALRPRALRVVPPPSRAAFLLDQVA
jgi:hypothetical protein